MRTLIATTAALIAVVVVCFGILDLINPFNDAYFDPEEWASIQGNQIAMIEDLQTRYLRPGVTRAEVLSLLGDFENVGRGYTVTNKNGTNYLKHWIHGQGLAELLCTFRTGGGRMVHPHLLRCGRSADQFQDLGHVIVGRYFRPRTGSRRYFSTASPSSLPTRR